jgi:hypothetical protein
MRYFSHDVFISVRTTNEYPFYPGQNFGDSISMMNINTTSSSDADGVFEKPSLIIHAADGHAAETVRKAYIDAGMSADAISIRGIPASTVRLWDRSVGDSWEISRPDLLGLITRLSVPLNVDKYNAYKSIVWPVRYYRAADSTQSFDPLEPPLKSRYSSKVIDEVADLGADFNMFVADVTSVHSKAFNSTLRCIQLSNLTAEGFYDDWDVILAKENNDSYVAGTRDATYGVPTEMDAADRRLIQGTSAVLIGVIHDETIKSAYSSVGLDVFLMGDYAETDWFLVRDLVGSAERYRGNSSYFFAIDFLPPGGCAYKGLQSTNWCVDFNESSISLRSSMWLGERIYSVFQTTIGSSANTTIGCKLLVFDTN